MSTAAPQDEKKKELLAELEKTKQAARWVRIRAQEWVGKGQHAEDLAEAVGNYVENIPDDSYKPRESWDRQIEDWRKVNEDFTNVNEMFMGVWGSLPNFPATVSSAGGFMSEETFLKLLPLNVRPEVTKATERFVEVAERAAPFQEATREMVRLGLDVAPPNQESAVSLLQEAWDAFEKPSSLDTAPRSVLIPLRESIERVLAELLRKRQVQQETKRTREKVRSIGSQLARQGLDQSFFARIGDEAAELLDKLSAAKQAEMTRTEVHLLLLRGTTFLFGLLNALDEGRFRK